MTPENVTKPPVEIAPAQPRCIWKSLGSGVEINEAAWSDQVERYLQPEVVRLLARLHRDLDRDRQELLLARVSRQQRFDAGELPRFLPRAVERSKNRVHL